MSTQSCLPNREAVEVIEATKVSGEIEVLPRRSVHLQLRALGSRLNPTFQST